MITFLYAGAGAARAGLLRTQNAKRPPSLGGRDDLVYADDKRRPVRGATSQ